MKTGGFLGFDCATRTGWAYIPPAARRGRRALPVSGSRVLGWEGCSETQYAGSIFKLATEKIEEFQPCAIAIEAPTLLQRDNAARVTHLHGMAGAVRVAAYLAGYKNHFYEYHLKTVKVHATGDQYADKEKMMAAARKLGWKFPNHDACDAIWIANLLETELTRPIERAAGRVA